MLRLAVLASVGLPAVASNSPESCAAGSTCESEGADDAAMIQLGRVGGRGKVRNSQGPGLDTVSKPWFPPDGAGPAPEQQPLIINVDGVDTNVYLPGATIIDDGRTVKFEPPYRFYMMNNPTTEYGDVKNFYRPDYMGKTFTIDMDFGHDGPACGCNLNFYLVNMPAATPGDEGDYYCDAQCFQGKGCCPEFDMNEGNKMIQQVTNHACTGKGSYSGHPDWECNKWGDPELKTHASDFSPGTQHTINSDEPFTYSQKFEMEGDQFVFTTTMTQGNRSKVLKMGPGNEQLNAMAKSIENLMVFVTGYWYASDMNWLDGEECGSGAEHCNMNPAYIKNWRLTSNDMPLPPTPAPPPTPPTPPPPTPAPGKGKCCWNNDCTGCQDDPSNYCNEDQGACTGGCGGQWCQ